MRWGTVRSMAFFCFSTGGSGDKRKLKVFLENFVSSARTLESFSQRVAMSYLPQLRVMWSFRGFGDSYIVEHLLQTYLPWPGSPKKSLLFLVRFFKGIDCFFNDFLIDSMIDWFID